MSEAALVLEGLVKTYNRGAVGEVQRLGADRPVQVNVRILAATTAANDAQKVRLVEQIKRDLGDDLRGKKIALWGLAFKPQTDDMREAPSIPMTQALLAAGAEVVGYDPAAT